MSFIIKILFGQTHQTMWGVARQNEFISTRFRTSSNAMLTLCRRTNLCYWWKQSTATQLSAVITQKLILLRAKCHFCRCCTRKPQHFGVVIVAVLVLLLFASWFLCVQRWHKVPTKTKYLMYGNRIGFWPKPHGLWHKQEKKREKKTQGQQHRQVQKCQNNFSLSVFDRNGNCNEWTMWPWSVPPVGWLQKHSHHEPSQPAKWIFVNSLALH